MFKIIVVILAIYLLVFGLTVTRNIWYPFAQKYAGVILFSAFVVFAVLFPVVFLL